MLSKVRLIDQGGNNANGTVALGSTVTVENLDNNKTLQFTIVGSAEVDVGETNIKPVPSRKALLGQKVGAQVDITVPRGLLHYRIISIDNCSEN